MKSKLATAVLSLVLALAMILQETGLFGAFAGTQQVFADEAFGEKAYEYMKKLSQEYSFRISTTEANANCREWLKSLVTGWGYKVQTCEFSGDSPHGWGPFSGESLIFDKKGQSDYILLICAHYDGAWSAACDDNGSGVGVLMENAERVAKMKLPYTIRFALFDGEETGCMGSSAYVATLSQEEMDRIVCVINVDSVAAGDNLMIYSGNYHADTNTFTEMWPLYSMMELADEYDVKLSLHPEVNGNFPVPTKMTGSDHAAFAAAGKPYIYFEASNWMGGDWDNMYQTDSPLVPKGKIMHNEEYDNFEFLDTNFRERVTTHLAEVSQLVYASMIGHLNIPKEAFPDLPEPTTEAPTTAETADVSTEAPVESTPVEAPTEESTPASETQSGSEAPTTKGEDETLTEAETTT
ncbi:MAG: M28 family peptidase, partial [Lachnospiraceae bacterium]|nr:M28 family peptidase [Lachnospiraceae bacterium]